MKEYNIAFILCNIISCYIASNINMNLINYFLIYTYLIFSLQVKHNINKRKFIYIYIGRSNTLKFNI